MEPLKPSVTALLTAASRAMHVVRDEPPHLFVDPYALARLGPDAERLLELEGRLPPGGARSIRANLVGRSRIAEDRLLRAVHGGVRQYVILGAGLDTFAWRESAVVTEQGLRVFEVDHPATQAWKRARMAALGMRHQRGLVFIAVDFDVDDLAGRLVAGGFDPGAPAFYSWLGVTMYLAPDSILGTLTTVAELAARTSLVVSYTVPVEMRSEEARRVRAEIAPVIGAGGEPWVSHFTPEEIGGLVERAGFATSEHVDLATDVLFSDREDGLRPDGVERLVIAST